MKKRLLKKLLSDEYEKIGKNYNKRVATRVKILARHYFAHWDNRGEAFIVERIPNKYKSIQDQELFQLIGKCVNPPKKLTYRVSRSYFERSVKK